MSSLERIETGGHMGIIKSCQGQQTQKHMEHFSQKRGLAPPEPHKANDTHKCWGSTPHTNLYLIPGVSQRSGTLSAADTAYFSTCPSTFTLLDLTVASCSSLLHLFCLEADFFLPLHQQFPPGVGLDRSLTYRVFVRPLLKPLQNGRFVHLIHSTAHKQVQQYRPIYYVLCDRS